MATIEKQALRKALKQYFGFETFKGLQQQANRKHNRMDIIPLRSMPTGGGKSLTYQLPALLKEGTAIVVSPLIALMKNQVDALRGISENQGIVHLLNSTLNKTEIKQVKEDIRNGITKLLYVAPGIIKKRGEYRIFAVPLNYRLSAIDEAHWKSEMGT